MFGRSKSTGAKPSGGMFGRKRRVDQANAVTSGSGYGNRSARNPVDMNSRRDQSLLKRSSINPLFGKGIERVKPIGNSMNRTQQNVRSRLMALGVGLPKIEAFYPTWRDEQPCGFFMRGPNDVAVRVMDSFLKLVEGAYGKSSGITVFDYDEYTHGITQRTLKILSLIYSSLSFYANDKGMGLKVHALVKRIHSLFVLATCDEYAGKEVRMYVAARESGNPSSLLDAKEVIASLGKSNMVRSVRSSFIDLKTIQRFSAQ